ncbi:hypothetical protein ACTL4S_07900 [Acinetobacter lwoffii]|uniref:hypothetical protein n=1 Tax=Acinetobacter lwoffii TaxID=28090 RepID=UPI003F8D07C2
MADVITKQDLIEGRLDVKSLGEAANEVKIVTPRYGAPYKSVPMLSQLFEAMLQTGMVKLDDLQNAINVALAAGAGANGWTADLVEYDGSTQKLFNDQIKAVNAEVDSRLESLRKSAPVLVDDYWVNGMADWGIAAQAAIDDLSEKGGGRLFFPSRIYDTSQTITFKSNIFYDGEFRGERGGLNGVLFRKNGNYIGIRLGETTLKRCDDIIIRNIAVDGNNYDYDGWSCEHLHYFDIDNLTSIRNKGVGRGFNFYYSWTGKIGQLFSMWNDVNYRFFFQCNALSIGHLYSSTANGGATKVGLQIGGLLGIDIQRITHEGDARYPVQILGYSQALNINSCYLEFDHTAAGIINAIYSNAADDAQRNYAVNIKNLMLIANNITVASPLIYASNSHKGLKVENAYIRLQGSADFSTVPVMKVNNSGANTDASNVVFDQIHINDSTTGNATTTYGLAFQGSKTTDGKATNITTTKATLKNTWGGLDYDQRVDGRIGAQLTPIGTVAPRYIGERFTATTKNRLYTANGLGLGDWARVDGAVELVDEPLFAAQGAWTLGAGWSVSGGDLVLNGTGAVSQQLDVKAGKYYRVRFEIKDRTSGSVSVGLGGVALGEFSANTVYDQIIRAVNFNPLTLNTAISGSLKFNYFSICESAAI